MNGHRNPYVGPRVFTFDDRDYFYGREREARDLLARVMSQRLVLFYAQSGAGKSSLINARLIPNLREADFAVLPVGRVSGELMSVRKGVDNIYLFNLMHSLDQSQGHPNRFAHLSLTDFLQRLVSEDGEHYTYDESMEPDAGGSSEPYPTVPYVLIIDQFEELITTHLGRWPEREDFFRQLNQAMLEDPNLWVVLTLREDYLAALDPFAILMRDRLRARFYMQRMSANAACEAVIKPAVRAGRPFAEDVARELVDDLRQVQIQHPDGSTFTELGPYVELVQLQVVCYRLWDNLAPETTEIARADLQVVGDVNQSLADYYSDQMAAVRIKSGLGERSIRDWVENQLISATGMRSQVLMEPEQSGGLANEVIHLLQDAHLVRAEKRSGATWFELTHDRLVEPIRQNNAAWRRAKLSLLQHQAALWEEQNRPAGLLLRGSALDSAESWASDYSNYLSPLDVEFLELCRDWRTRRKRARAQERKELEMAQKLAAVERTKRRAIALIFVLTIVAIVGGGGGVFFSQMQRDVAKATAVAAVAQVTANAVVVQVTANAAVAQAAANAAVAQAVADAAVAQGTANAAVAQGTANAAVAQATAAAATAQGNTDTSDVAAQATTAAAEAREIAETAVAQATAEASVAQATAAAAVAHATAAATLAQATAAAAVPPNSPSIGARWYRPKDGAAMVYVQGGTFLMGSDAEDSEAYSNERPQHEVELGGYWIDITEVTNLQFASFVADTGYVTTAQEQGYGMVYNDGRFQEVPGAYWTNPHGAESNLNGLDNHPVVQISWIDASNYCTWTGGQLPTEAQWEYAARGRDNRIFPWGDVWDSSLLSYQDADRDAGYTYTAPVGSFSPAGDSWIGAADMAGNVWEWVTDWYDSNYYETLASPANNPTGPDSGEMKVIRGGSWGSTSRHVRSSRRLERLPTTSHDALGFRCVFAAGG